MAAEEMARAGLSVIVTEAKPSVARKFLMAGKSGLNLTKSEPFETLIQAYDEAAEWLRPMLAEFDALAVQDWAKGLDQELFTGSSGRVFPTVMKASPLLRAWIGRLTSMGVEMRTRHRWIGWQDGQLAFDTTQDEVLLGADVTVLAMGGASWARLGADGAWADVLAKHGVSLAPFKPSNAGLLVEWSTHMQGLFGQPVKGVAWRAGGRWTRGEAVISARGLEGGGIYTISKEVREGARLSVDLTPDVSLDDVARRLARPRGKTSLSNHLRKVLKLGPVRTGLLMEFGRPLPGDAKQLAHLIKDLPVNHAGLRPMDEAISTAGGVRQEDLDEGLMLRRVPGVFCAGEMLDWEAPTGGYLLTACFASGRWAGRAAAEWVRQIQLVSE